MMFYIKMVENEINFVLLKGDMMKKSKIIKLFIILMILTGCTTSNTASSVLTLKKVNGFLENKDEDKRILVLYHDSNDLLDNLNKMIQKKMAVDLYEIGSVDDISLEKYDLILIGSIARDNHPSLQLQQFLSQYDFSDKDVSFYWIDGNNYEEYEKNISSYVDKAKILPSLVLNSDEVSKAGLVNVLLDGWLTSVYTPVN